MHECFDSERARARAFSAHARLAFCKTNSSAYTYMVEYIVVEARQDPADWRERARDDLLLSHNSHIRTQMHMPSGAQWSPAGCWMPSRAFVRCEQLLRVSHIQSISSSSRFVLPHKRAPRQSLMLFGAQRRGHSRVALSIRRTLWPGVVVGV